MFTYIVYQKMHLVMCERNIQTINLFYINKKHTLFT